MTNAAGGPGPGQPAPDAADATQEPVVTHAADRAIQEAQRHHEAPDLEPESVDVSDGGDSEPNDSEGSDDER